MLPSLRPFIESLSRQPVLISPFLLPFFQTQHRATSILSSLSDNRAAYNRKIRRGRGPSSGKGKTAGRGYGGQKQHGKVPFGFNGGQTKDVIVNPPRGMNNTTVFTTELTLLNLDHLLEWIAQGRIDPARPITTKELGDSRCINPRKFKDGVKLLARGSDKITFPINIVVSRASATAIAAIEAAGGSVTTRYYTRASIQRIMQGKTDPINSLQSQPNPRLMPTFTVREGVADSEPKAWQNRLPDPVSRKAIEYYRDPAHRGYMSYQLAEGQTPSLFFKKPPLQGLQARGRSRKAKEQEMNRVW